MDPQLSLLTSSERLPAAEPDLLSLALLALVALGGVAALLIGRTWLAIVVWLGAGVIVIIQALLPIAGQQEMLAALLLLALVATADVASKLKGKLAGSMASIVALGVAGFGGYLGVSNSPEVVPISDRQLPALVVAFADVDQMTRTLRLEVGEEIQAELIWGDGISQDEMNLLYDRTLPSSQLSGTLAQLAGSLVAGNPADISQLMSATSVDFVLLAPGEHPARAEAEVALSTLAILQSSGESEFGTLYRLDDLQPGEGGQVASDFAGIQLGLLAAYLLLSIPTPATIRGYRKVRSQ